MYFYNQEKRIFRKPGIDFFSYLLGMGLEWVTEGGAVGEREMARRENLRKINIIGIFL